MRQKSRSPYYVALAKYLAISGVLLLFCFTFNPFCNKSCRPSSPVDEVIRLSNSSKSIEYPTNLSHIKFVLVGSLKTWAKRRPYTEAWWRPNETRGHIFMETHPSEEFLPWPETAPSFRVSEDSSKLPVYPKLANPIEARIFRAVLDSFKLGDNRDVRWFVMADDDTVFFVDNLVDILRKYNHAKHQYVGMYSECVISNFLFSFDMAYGGAGYAMSYSLVEELAPLMNECLERYPYSHTSDSLTSSCLFDMGISLTIERGVHQIDLLGDISGMLSSHPQDPIVTLHHFDNIDPIFPQKNRTEAINHLMQAAKVDQSRLAQQTICYHRPSNWSFSISWGYSAHIYENIIPRSILRRPLETFQPWKNGPPPIYMFNTRVPNDDPCQAPHVFFMESVKKIKRYNSQILTTYKRHVHRRLPPCLFAGNHSADGINRIQVVSNSTARKELGRIECCNVKYMPGMTVANVKLRNCRKSELIPDFSLAI